MKKVVLAICIVVLLGLLLSAVSGKTKAPAEGEPRFSSVSEAAFSMRSSGAEDATSRLVGSYTAEDGQKLSFNGAGEVRRIAQNLSYVTGRYFLLQSPDGAAILDVDLDGKQCLYSFVISSPDGSFTLTDSDGTAKVFTPVPV